MNEDKKSYRHILKSTGIIGGSQVLIILVGIIKTKIIAVILGPTGYGISSSLQATIDLMRQATSFGINFSAVREISQYSKADNFMINRTLTILNKWAIYTGVLGFVVTILFSSLLSMYAFDTTDYRWYIVSASIVLLLTSVSSAQIAVLQGFRLLKDMAVASVVGAIIGVVFIIPMFFLWGISAIVPSMVIVATINLIVSWLFTRKIKYDKINMSFRETIICGKEMARLGSYLVATGFIITLIMYTIRAFIIRQIGLDAVGWFQSAWSISNIYIGVVLSAMGADFFPRLSAVHSDNSASNILINQQLEMMLVIVSPLLVALIGASELVINILYSYKFSSAVPLLQWQLAGGLFSVLSWCLGVMFLAKNKGYYSLLTESVFGCVYLLFILQAWDKLGFVSLGVGYVFATLLKTILVMYFVKSIGQFKFEHKTLRLIFIYSLCIGLILLNVLFFDSIWQYLISCLLFIITTVISYKELSKIIDIKSILKQLVRYRR